MTDGLESGAAASSSSENDDVDAAWALLNRLRAGAAERGDRRVDARQVARSRARAKDRELSREGKAADRARRGEADSYYGRDPQGISRIFDRFLSERGWKQPIAVGGVLARWSELVGKDIAEHCRAESFENSTVHVRCDTTAWATNLRLMAPEIVRQLNERLGDGVVTRLEIAGPAAPTWRRGYRTVKGRGPRDTYG
ncbi:DUF721 domain-containing protein [Falsarthrobacter nasiphocae]|uniref:Nucleic acid-binding Zn ribbon protein n=1 Tax=Falsarthrobacter nasiphocae TaxID=189863 RepID=A0AAE3YH23_9MICC|nr:DciA family protein [Falsarthrobacter nasiphocae]MDR6892069.1 putative nucleic acid-binding Zn ribbon protein [Falsarthrobacter nasiphocae]